MAGTVAPNIVTNGLVLYLDAANTKSYPGSGTIWTDIAAGNNGTLTNGPTFNSGSGGSIVFDGVDDYIDTPYVTAIGTNDFSYSVWIKYSTSQIGAIVAKRVGSPTFEQFTLFVAGDPYGNTAGTYICCDDYNSGGRYVNTVNTYGDGNWHHVAVVRNSTGVLVYVDGISQSLAGVSTSAIPNLSTTSKLFIGRSGENQSVGAIPFNGSISLVQVYNLALSSTEIQQNYNSTKTRFGL
jgi:hypothetical protein